MSVTGFRKLLPKLNQYRKTNIFTEMTYHISIYILSHYSEFLLRQRISVGDIDDYKTVKKGRSENIDKVNSSYLTYTC